MKSRSPTDDRVEMMYNGRCRKRIRPKRQRTVKECMMVRVEDRFGVLQDDLRFQLRTLLLRPVHSRHSVVAQLTNIKLLCDAAVQVVRGLEREAGGGAGAGAGERRRPQETRPQIAWTESVPPTDEEVMDPPHALEEPTRAQPRWVDVEMPLLPVEAPRVLSMRDTRVWRAPSNGSCMYHSILGNNRVNNVLDLRERLADWAEEHWDEYVESVGRTIGEVCLQGESQRQTRQMPTVEQRKKKYLRDLRKISTWGDEPELMMLSMMPRAGRIEVYTADAPHWHRLSVYGQGEAGGKGLRVVRLWYEGGNHYNRIITSREMREVFPQENIISPEQLIMAAKKDLGPPVKKRRKEVVERPLLPPVGEEKKKTYLPVVVHERAPGSSIERRLLLPPVGEEEEMTHLPLVVHERAPRSSIERRLLLPPVGEEEEGTHLPLVVHERAPRLSKERAAIGMGSRLNPRKAMQEMELWKRMERVALERGLRRGMDWTSLRMGPRKKTTGRAAIGMGPQYAIERAALEQEPLLFVDIGDDLIQDDSNFAQLGQRVATDTKRGATTVARKKGPRRANETRSATKKGSKAVTKKGSRAKARKR